MSSRTATVPDAPRGGREHGAALTEARSAHGDTKRIVVDFGFWLFLISDIILLAAFFATYAVLTDATAGGPNGADLFDLRSVALETGCLLASSLFCGLAGVGARARMGRLFQPRAAGSHPETTSRQGMIRRPNRS